MFKVCAGSLSATFNLDGDHLDRYLQRRELVTRSMCEELILHDQILIPTQDYLTACGLTLVLGERNLISLLEADLVRFVRLRGAFGYVRGTGPDGGLVTFGDPDARRPQDSSIEASVDAGLSVIDGKIDDKRKLKKLLVQQSTSVELSEVLESVKQDSYADLKETELWKDEYEFSNKDLLALPGMEEMQVRVLGPGTDIRKNVVDTLLTLALFNIELYLSLVFQCASNSTGSALGDSIDLKIARLSDQSLRSENIWSLLEINNVPDIGRMDLSEGNHFDQLLKIARSSSAAAFREWFHERKDFDEKEIFAEYLELMREVPWVQRLPSRVLRFALCAGLSFDPVIGNIASFLDAFVVEKLLKGKSPIYFIEDLRRFRGRIKLRSSGANTL